jgi:predicted P-loop ATPase
VKHGAAPYWWGRSSAEKPHLGEILFGAPFWVEGLADLSRDSRMRCQTAWGVELSELDGITRRRTLRA